MDHMRLKALRAGAALIVMIALVGAPAAVAAAEAPADAGSCVGQFSSFFAQGGFGTHRSIVAQDFAKNARPAGLNVYSHVAKGHGALDECFAEFAG
jgi:hypothetical protein